MVLLSNSFSRLHSISSTLNLVSLISAGLVGWKIGANGVGPFSLGYGAPQ
jgi:ABC-type methionine transport system permease subunit